MKKWSVLLTFFVLVAMTLAACATGTPGIPATGPGTAAPTGVTTSAVPTTGAVETPTVAVENTATTAPTDTVEVTETAVATGTAAATGTATALATATESEGLSQSTMTPGAGETGTPQASANQEQFLRLSNIMTMAVQSNDLQEVGTVNSVVIQRPIVAAGTTGSTSTVDASAPFVRYVVVDVSAATSGPDTGNQVLIPWQAFNMSGLSLGPVVVNTPPTALTLNVGPEAFTGAPRVDVTEIQSGANNGWQSQYSQYWSGHGLTIPATGPEADQPGSMLIIGKEFNGINIVAGGDATGSNNAVLGQVADFLVNPTTGEIAYAVFDAQSLGGQSFFVPLSHLSWVLPVGQNDIATLGSLQLNFSPDILQNAPNFGMLNNLQLSEDWVQQLNQFWQGVQNSTTP